MRVILASMPRSGSQFTMKLIETVMGVKFPGSSFSITPGRRITNNCQQPQELNEFIRKGKGVEYFRKLNDHFFKIESPGNDTLCLDLSAFFPDIKWIVSMRKIEDIITSHFNLLTWGWPEKKIIIFYKNDLFIYEYISKKYGLQVVNIDEPNQFDLDKLINYLEIDSINVEAENFIQKWSVVNPLSYQKEKSNEKPNEKEIPENLNTLRLRHPWINDIEYRMLKLLEKSNADV